MFSCVFQIASRVQALFFFPLIAVTKYLTRSNFRESLLRLTVGKHSQLFMVENEQWQRYEAAGHTEPTVRSREQISETGYKAHLPSPEKPHLLKLSQPSKAGLPCENQVFKHKKTVHILATFPSYLNGDIFKAIYMQQ